MVLTYVLKSPRVGLAEEGKPLTWMFYVILPNFCFGDAIQNIYLNYQTLKLCSTVEPYCKVFKSPNPCCAGQSIISIVTSAELHYFREEADT